MDKHITLVEEDLRGLTAEEKDPVALRRAERWITRRGYVLTLVLIVIWPLLSIPAGVFSESYFAFWVLVAIAWGFGAALTLAILPLSESSEEINTALSGIWNYVTGREPVQAQDPDLAEEKEVRDSVETPLKEVESVEDEEHEGEHVAAA